MISQYDVEIDQDGDGATLVGTVTIDGTQRKLVIDRIEGQKFGVDLIGKEIMDLADFVSAMKEFTEARKELDGKLDHYFYGANFAYKLMLEKVQAIQKRINY
jgi:hypothetical protein